MTVEQLMEELRRHDPKTAVTDLENRDIQCVTSVCINSSRAGECNRARRVVKLTPWRIEPKVGG